MSNKNPLNNIIHFGLDHLEVYASFFDEVLFTGLDFDNSNHIFFDDLSGIKSDVKNYEYGVHFSKDNTPIFSYFKGSSKANIKTKDYVAIYSSCFRLYGKAGALEILEKYFIIPRKKYLRRFDICADFNLSIQEVLGKFKKAKEKGALFFDEKGGIETRYIGQKQKSKNKRQLLRIYNKQSDIIAKGKNRLYADYFLYDNITRIELEIRRELAKNSTLEELFIDENLEGIIKNYTRKFTTIFQRLKVEKITLYRKPKKVDFEIEQTFAYKMSRTKIFLGHARGLLERGIDPIFLLLSQDIIHPKTRKILEENGNFLEIIGQLKSSSENWKNILNNL